MGIFNPVFPKSNSDNRPLNAPAISKPQKTDWISPGNRKWRLYDFYYISMKPQYSLMGIPILVCAVICFRKSISQFATGYRLLGKFHPRRNELPSISPTPNWGINPVSYSIFGPMGTFLKKIRFRTVKPIADFISTPSLSENFTLLTPFDSSFCGFLNEDG